MNNEITEVQLACFRLMDDLYAVDIMRIREIIRPQKLTPLPKAPPFIEGVINLRGTVIPVVDLRKRFEMEQRGESAPTRLLIVRIGGQSVGLVVDEVTEVISVSVKDIKPPPSVAEGMSADFLIGVCLSGDMLVMLLNIDMLLTSSEVKVLENIN